MNAKSDPRFAFEPELALRITEPVVTTRRTWLPTFAQELGSLDVTRWQSRAAHGFSWHRTGRAVMRRGVH
jgi:hypothetical protein